MIRGLAAVGLAGLLVASAARSSIPPPPPDDAPFIAASCRGAPMGLPLPVAATVTRLATVPLHGTGAMTMQWGVRITTHDRRIGDLTLLAFSGEYGLIATTSNRDWLTLDLRGGTLNAIKTVNMAPVRDATATPVSIANLGRNGLFVGFADGRGTIARYAMMACGTNAAGIPWITATDTAEPYVVQGAYSYLGVAAPQTDRGSALVSSYTKATVTLPAAPNPFVPAGERLIAMGNPAVIVPYIITLTRSAKSDAPGATLRLVYADDWADVRGGGLTIPPRILLRFAHTPSAMAVIGTRGGVTSAILAFPTDIPGTIDLYRFDIGSADLDPFNRH